MNRQQTFHTLVWVAHIRRLQIVVWLNSHLVFTGFSCIQVAFHELYKTGTYLSPSLSLLWFAGTPLMRYNYIICTTIVSYLLELESVVSRIIFWLPIKYMFCIVYFCLNGCDLINWNCYLQWSKTQRSIIKSEISNRQIHLLAQGLRHSYSGLSFFLIPTKCTSCCYRKS